MRRKLIGPHVYYIEGIEYSRALEPGFCLYQERGDQGMAKRKYEADTKDVAVEAYDITGSPALVGKMNGIPPTTVSSWAHRDREKMEEKQGEAGGDEASKTAEILREMRLEKKKSFIEEGWKLAKKILNEMEKKIPNANFKDLATGMGILFDKIALASGEATARTESTKTVSREDMLDAARAALDEKTGRHKPKAM